MIDEQRGMTTPVNSYKYNPEVLNGLGNSNYPSTPKQSLVDRLEAIDSRITHYTNRVAQVATLIDYGSQVPSIGDALGKDPTPIDIVRLLNRIEYSLDRLSDETNRLEKVI